ncbi:ABC transporter ATP-binding protein [Verrucosispora sp. WMMD573]|uniref:ABC transporter ATP-binding protein n=1 Tax=Verrucosispora sp. WMMD573 TaxID=3015149 RepID=UPI00248B75AE|nr:ABC transporter ATP-binding protein [Verrucosispora sp. WMMD573]WBB53733.1 ABC transporter ATP-binding protein [Verrucosispora sp. WMMD573]
MRTRWETYLDEAVRPRILIVRQLPHAGLGLVSILVAVNVALAALPVAFVILSSLLAGRVADAVTDASGGGWSGVTVVLGWTCAVFLAQQTLTPLQVVLGEKMQRRVDGYFESRLMTASLSTTGLAPLEDQQTLDLLREATRKLESRFQTPGHATAGMLALIARYLRLVAFAALVASVTDVLAGVGVFAAAMAFRYGQRGGMRRYSRVWREVLASEREADYFRDVATRPMAAKEIRVFGLVGWLTGEYRRNYLDVIRPVWAQRRRIYLFPFFGYLALGLLIGGAVAASIAYAGAQGQLSLAEVALGLQATVAALLLGEHYPESDANTQFGMTSVSALETFEHRLRSRRAEDIADTAGLDAAGLPVRDIRFEGVSFQYPDAGRPVLAGLDLQLRAGECTAIVGLNGAGKTTLVKLLARLYEPTAGSVLVDGVDLATFDVESWRRQLAVIFQDFTRYEFSATDNIALGAVEVPVDDARVLAAAERAGIADALTALPHGLDTTLSREYEGGADLSGGQWQRVAIARSLFAVAAGARLLVLDEPTSALDIRAEAEFFARFVELTRGVTSVLVSHRFSSVRHADRIVVLEHGRVIEDGTHESLMAAGGRYAGLFHLQADRFAVDGRQAR